MKLDAVPLCIVNHSIKTAKSVNSFLLPLPVTESKTLINSRRWSAEYNVHYSPVSGNQAQRQESYTSQREQRSQCMTGIMQEIY